MELQFSERQRATVAAALTVLGTAVIIWAVWTASLLLARFVAFFSGVFLPLAVAAILAVLLRPIYLAVLTMVINLLTDLAYKVADPRVVLK